MKNVRFLIIFPDIHGRDFWRPVVGKYKDNTEYGFIFLGDYVDPYPDIDGISEDESFYNLNELSTAVLDHPRTVMLLGNHDWHYMPWMRGEGGCRRSRKYFDSLSEFFYRNFDRFDIACSHTISDGRRYLFTHAGVDSMWARQLAASIYADSNFLRFYDAAELNSLKTASDVRRSMLWRISAVRGGGDRYASCLWSGLGDMIYDSTQLRIDTATHPEFAAVPYQVFGHSYSSRPMITDRFAMLDCKKPFLLDCLTGSIAEMTE